MTVARRVICNAGPLIALAKLNRLDLLAGLYRQVQIPPAVYDEVVIQGLARGAADARTVQLFWQQSGWPVIDVSHDVGGAFRPGSILDAGETEVLALARGDPDTLVLIDDEMARAESRRLGLEVKGTLGILVQARRRDLISFEELELLIQQIAARPDIWIGARLCEEVLKAMEQEETQRT